MEKTENSWEYTLTSEELKIAELWAGSVKKIKPERALLQAKAVIGVAKLLSVPVIDEDPPQRVGYNIGVKAVAAKGDGLIFTDRDKDGKAFILARVDGKTVEAIGWSRFDESARTLAQPMTKEHMGKAYRIGVMRIIDLNTMQSLFDRLSILKKNVPCDDFLGAFLNK